MKKKACFKFYFSLLVLFLLFLSHSASASTLISRTGTDTTFSTIGTYSQKGFFILNTGSYNDGSNLGIYSWFTILPNTHYYTHVPIPTGITCESLGFAMYYQYEYGSYANAGATAGVSDGVNCKFDLLTPPTLTDKFGRPAELVFPMFFDRSGTGTDFSMVGDSSTSFRTHNIQYGEFINYGTPAFEIRDTKHNPVLIIPGVMGTEMFENSNRLWLDLAHNFSDIGDQFMDSLGFNNNLIPTQIDIGLGKVIDKEVFNIGISNISIFDYTNGLVQEFLSQGYKGGFSSTSDLFTFPYDWRYGISDSNVSLLKSNIEDIRAQTGSDKVDIVAHSTGGLLLKKYAIDNPTDNHIGKAVFVGVPNTGAPKAVKTLLQGDDFGNPFLADSEMKKLAENFPVVYDLTPSEQYYNQKGSYIKIINRGVLSATEQNLNFNESNSFLINDHSLNSQALSNAHNLHTTAFDNFDLRTLGIDLYAIDGCKAGTFGQVVEVRDKDILGNVTVSYNQPREVPGDGTVPLESATNLPIDSSHKYYALKASHGQMLSQSGIRQNIVNVISGSNLDIGGGITQDISRCKLNGKVLYL
jgi:pimeloyl-ACP methyl ester carboxylesterase